MPTVPLGSAGVFAQAAGEQLSVLRSGAGLGEVEVSEVPTPLRAGSFEEWWTRTRALAGPLASILAALPLEAAYAIESRLREAVKPYEAEDGLDLPGVTLVAIGRCAPV